ncbi:MAG: hypothetical protein IT449_09230 [Phycisphaerales bacterium]|nr:hypothetical protein [Phycisphaerales bacterium]
MHPTAEEIYAVRIEPLADDEKLRLVELIAHELAVRKGGRSLGDGAHAVRLQATRERFRRHAGAVGLGRPTGADNESIDADLAHEFGSDCQPN